MRLDNFDSNLILIFQVQEGRNLLRLKFVKTEIIDRKDGQAFLPEHVSDYI